MQKPIVHHIPVCPFCQRLEILLALKGQPDAVEFRVVDITRPRDPGLLAKTRGTTALPEEEPKVEAPKAEAAGAAVVEGATKH